MDSNLAFLYESLLSLITDQLLDMFNGALSKYITKAIEDVSNVALAQMEITGMIHGMNNSAHTDQRWLQINTSVGVFDTYSTGQQCWRRDVSPTDQYCFGWLDTEISKRSQLTTNDDMQYYLEKQVFEGQLKLIRDEKLMSFYIN